VGHWENGKVEGYGVHTTYNGQKYTGLFQGFLKNGTGR
jgi:hypothetical protein